MLFGMCLALLPVKAAAQGASPKPTDTDLAHASMLYRELYDLKKLEADLSKSTNIIMFVRMVSKRGVAATNLTAFVDAKSGQVPLTFAPDGAFLLLMSEDLYKENPFVRCNQPKGSMSIDWGWYVKGIEKASNYRELMLPVEEFRKIVATMGKHNPQLKGAAVTGMKFFFKPGTPAKITLEARKGAKYIEADEKGECLLLYDSGLIRENPSVAIPLAPERIDFVFKGAP